MRFAFISLLRFAVLPKPDRCNELGGSSIFKTMASTTSTKYVLPGFCILFCYALRKKEDMGAVSTTASMASMASNMAQYFPRPNLKSHFRVSRCRLFAKKMADVAFFITFCAILRRNIWTLSNCLKIISIYREHWIMARIPGCFNNHRPIDLRCTAETASSEVGRGIHPKIVIELRQYKNDSIWSNDKLALNLPRFFTRLYG